MVADPNHSDGCTENRLDDCSQCRIGTAIPVRPELGLFDDCWSTVISTVLVVDLGWLFGWVGCEMSELE